MIHSKVLKVTKVIRAFKVLRVSPERTARMALTVQALLYRSVMMAIGSSMVSRPGIRHPVPTEKTVRMV